MILVNGFRNPAVSTKWMWVVLWFCSRFCTSPGGYNGRSSEPNHQTGGWPAQFLKNGGFSYDCFLLEWHRLSGAILSIRALRGCVNSMFPPSPSKQWKKWRYKVEISSMIASLVPGSPILSCIAQRNNEVICWTTGGHTRPFQKWLLFRWINPHHFPPPQKIDSNHVKKMLIKQNAKKG